MSELKAGQTPQPLVENPKEGAAEVLYGLGAAGIRQDDELPALVYLRLSLYLRPGDDLTSVTLANLFEQMKKDELAIAAYEAVPASSPLREDARNPGGARARQPRPVGRGDQAPPGHRRGAGRTTSMR